MKIYRIPDKCSAVIFDIDGTLYTCPEYVFEQIDSQVRRLGELRGITADEARALVADFRKKYAAEHNGSQISLGNLLTCFGIPIQENIEWRKTLFSPEKYLHKDEKLIRALTDLARTKRLVCVTNNPVDPARRTLKALGIDTIIPDIIGLDTCGKSKPDRKPFELAAQTAGFPLAECIAVGDRYDIDVALPLQMGMGGIVVSGVEEIYTLHELLDK
jgi:HAD superfamily hydrolase (TIGR01549 family)